MTVFGEEAKGIVANNWRKGNIIIIWYQQWENQWGQAGWGSPMSRAAIMVASGWRLVLRG